MSNCGNPNCPTCKPEKRLLQVAEELEDRIHSIQRDLEQRTSDTVSVDFDVVLIMRVITAIRAPQTLSEEDRDHLDRWTHHVVKQFPLPPQDLDLLKRIWLLGA